MDRRIYNEIVKPLLVDDPLPVINWMKEKKLLPREVKCELCEETLNWTKNKSSRDMYAWRCMSKNCSKYKHTISIRKGTIFSQSKITLQQWIHVIFCWTSEMNEKLTTSFTNISERSIQELFGLFRETCTRYFKENPVQLVGPGTVVQIDESSFSHKVKHHRGRAGAGTLWVFGMVDTSFSPAIGYMEIVEKRDQITLLPIINRVARRGSIIHSDEWRAYRNISEDFNHQTVNHTLHFVDPETGVHTQHVESYWNKHKYRIKSMRGCQRHLLQGYLNEFMWMERNRTCKFLKVCKEFII